MSKIIAYIPTYSPNSEADLAWSRPYARATSQQIAERIASDKGRKKPTMYMDAVDSVINTRPDIQLIVADGKSTDSIRAEMRKHQAASGGYELIEYQEKKSQWWIWNDILERYATPETEYFIYTSSDVIWQMDWVSEAIKEFEKNPKLQILFPYVSSGDPNLPAQVSTGPRDLDPIPPPFQREARAPCLNAYAMIFRMDFLRIYGGYPTIFRNCFTESFLAYMCDAVGGEMRILPRGWVFHYGEGDKWLTPGSAYYYTEEKFTFQSIMDRVLMARTMGIANVNFYKKILYK